MVADVKVTRARSKDTMKLLGILSANEQLYKKKSGWICFVVEKFQKSFVFCTKFAPEKLCFFCLLRSRFHNWGHCFSLPGHAALL